MPRWVPSRLMLRSKDLLVGHPPAVRALELKETSLKGVIANALVETMTSLVTSPREGGHDLVAAERACHQREQPIGWDRKGR